MPNKTSDLNKIPSNKNTGIIPSECDFSQILDCVNNVKEFVIKSAEQNTAAHVVEDGILRSILKMGAQLFGCFIKLQGDGDIGEFLILKDGRTIKRMDDYHKRDYQSIFGMYSFLRAVYSKGKGKKIEHIPLDAKLQLPESKFSYLLQDWDQLLCVESPYSKGKNIIERILGIQQHVDSLERMSQNMSQQVNHYWEQLPTPSPEEEGKILVASSDGKGVVIRNKKTTNDDEKSKESKEILINADDIKEKDLKKGKKKMALLGSVYSIDPYIRSPEDVLKALFDDKGDTKYPPRPKPIHKHVRASLLRDEKGTSNPSYEEIFGWLGETISARNSSGGLPQVLLMDGQESLWNAGKEYLTGNVIEILDLLHATSYVWKAGKIFFKENALIENFVKPRIKKILNGKVDSVIRSLQIFSATHKLNKEDRKTIKKICGYFTNNKNRMKYDEYLAKGYPIASGVIEGACRNLIVDRMERSGMRWVMRGAQAMLKLRSIHLSDLWTDFINFFIKAETARLYPNVTFS